MPNVKLISLLLVFVCQHCEEKTEKRFSHLLQQNSETELMETVLKNIHEWLKIEYTIQMKIPLDSS